jgi:hypothetical protein
VWRKVRYFRPQSYGSKVIVPAAFWKKGEGGNAGAKVLAALAADREARGVRNANCREE